MPVKLGLIGLGYWGPNLLRNFQNTHYASVIACADLDSQKIKKIAQKYPNISFYKNYRKLLLEDLNAVIIATPPSSHYEIIKAALQSNKHVFVEKPVTTNYSQALEIAKIAQAKRKILMVDHIFVYSNAVEKIKGLIDKKKLGDLYYFDSTRVNLGLLQSNTSVLWDLASHDVSILEYLINDRPLSIHCVGSSHTLSRQEDIAFVTIKYPGNFIAHINVNWLAPSKIRRIVVAGSKKMVVYDEASVEEKVKIIEKGISELTGHHRHEVLTNYRIGDSISPYLPARETLVDVCAHFINCILKNRRPITNGFSGARVVKILEKAEFSLISGMTYKFSTADFKI